MTELPERRTDPRWTDPRDALDDDLPGGLSMVAFELGFWVVVLLVTVATTGHC